MCVCVCVCPSMFIHVCAYVYVHMFINGLICNRNIFMNKKTPGGLLTGIDLRPTTLRTCTYTTVLLLFPFVTFIFPS